MPDIWAFIVGAIVLLIIYGIVSSKLKDRRKRKLREKTLPIVEDALRSGVSYNVHLNDGHTYNNVKLAGTAEASSGQFVLGGWEGMLVLLQQNGKRAFVRQAAVRRVEEI